MTDLLTQLGDYGRQIESDPMLGATPLLTVEVGTRRPHTRLGRGLVWAVAAFVVVLTVGGLSLVFSGDDGQVVDQITVPAPTTVPKPAPNPTPVTHENRGPLEPGAYLLLAGGDGSTNRGGTVVLEDPGWTGSIEGISRPGVSLHVHQINYQIAATCGEGILTPARSTADLADRFAANGFTVLEPPAPVSAFGHDGHHVVIEVPCFLGNSQPVNVMEVWFVDVDGIIMMVEALWLDASRITFPPLLEPGGIGEASEEDLAELRAVLDTLVLTP